MKKLFYFLICLGCSSFYSAKAQIISTVAGNDTATHTGDGGPATLASVLGPYSVTLDHLGNMYIADQYANRVRRVSPAGIITTIAGNGTAGYGGDGFAATNARLNQPSGVAVDAAGNIYISDMLNNVVRKVNTSGIISTYAGNFPGGGYSGDGVAATASTVSMHTPIGLTVDASGNLYVCEVDNDIVRKISSTGIISNYAGIPMSGGYDGDHGVATDARLNQPIDLCVDAAGNIYVADYSNNAIRKIDNTGTITTVAGTGSSGFSGDGGQATMAKLNSPTGIALGNAGELFIADAFNQRIREVYPSGVLYTLGGSGVIGYTGDGGLAHYATLNYPYGGVVDTAGDFIFADFANNAIRKITPFHNHAPAFVSGHTLARHICGALTDTLSTYLSVSDLDTNQIVNWVVVSGPAHGTATSTAYILTTGAALAPSANIWYNAATGYSGTDVLKIAATDGIGADTVTITYTVDPSLTTPVISGRDSVCELDTAMLSVNETGGTWASSSTAIATVNVAGVVTGLSRGIDTIVYTITNLCGTEIGSKPIFIRNHDTCLLAGNMVLAVQQGVSVYPNPGTNVFTFNVQTGTQTNAAHLMICDLMGAKMYEAEVVTNHENEVKLNLPTGVYLYSVTHGADVYTGRLEVQR